MTTGDQLRNARRSRGMTIEQISRVTKITPQILRALESDDHARLPGWVFTRGFLKSYASEVGLDPYETVTTFLAQNAPGPAPALEQPANVGHASDVSVIAEPEPIELEPSTDIGQMIAVAVIVVAAVAYLGLHNQRGSNAKAAPAVAAAAHHDAAAVPVATAGAAAPQAVASESPDLKLEFVATGECWISATVDDQPPIQRLMNAGERKAVTAQSSVTLRVGDPAAFELIVNGAPGKVLGQASKPVTIHVTPQNARDYLAR